MKSVIATFLHLVQEKACNRREKTILVAKLMLAAQRHDVMCSTWHHPSHEGCFKSQHAAWAPRACCKLTACVPAILRRVTLPLTRPLSNHPRGVLVGGCGWPGSRSRSPDTILRQVHTVIAVVGFARRNLKYGDCEATRVVLEDFIHHRNGLRQFSGHSSTFMA